jgi:hypothetical protein
MSETGSTWQRAFKAHPSEARALRAWTAKRTPHPDAPLVADELFVAILSAGADVVDMKLSTAGDRLQLSATGPDLLSVRHSHGPGWRIVEGVSRITGVTTDGQGLWAELEVTR